MRRQIIQGYGKIQFQSPNNLDADLDASGPAFMQMAAAVAPCREKMQMESRKIQSADEFGRVKPGQHTMDVLVFKDRTVLLVLAQRLIILLPGDRPYLTCLKKPSMRMA